MTKEVAERRVDDVVDEVLIGGININAWVLRTSLSDLSEMMRCLMRTPYDMITNRVKKATNIVNEAMMMKREIVSAKVHDASKKEVVIEDISKYEMPGDRKPKALTKEEIDEAYNVAVMMIKRDTTMIGGKVCLGERPQWKTKKERTAWLATHKKHAKKQ